MNQLIKPYYKEMPDLLKVMIISMEINLYFHNAAQERLLGKHSAYIENLKKAVDIQDRLDYDELPACYALN